MMLKKSCLAHGLLICKPVSLGVHGDERMDLGAAGALRVVGRERGVTRKGK